MSDVHINGLITRQQRAHRECGQIFQLQQISEIAGREFCNVCAEFVRSDRAIAFAVANDEQLALDAGERSSAQQRSDGCCVCMVELFAFRRFRVFNRNRASQVMTEAEQQRKTAARIDAQRARLRIAKPSFGDEIVKEGMQATLRDIGLYPERQRVGNGGRLLALQVRGIVGKDATSTGLLLEPPSIDVLQIDLAPKCARHIKLGLYSSISFLSI